MNVTLTTARNFLLLPFIKRLMVLKELNLLGPEELSILSKSKHIDSEVAFFQVAFSRVKGRFGLLESKIDEVMKR